MAPNDKASIATSDFNQRISESVTVVHCPKAGQTDILEDSSVRLLAVQIDAIQHHLSSVVFGIATARLRVGSVVGRFCGG